MLSQSGFEVIHRVMPASAEHVPSWNRLRDKGPYALPLVTILILAALCRVPAAAAISDYEILSHTMCKTVTSQGVCTKEAHAFDASDARAYLHFRVKMGETGTITADNEWHYQSGSKEAGGDWDSTRVRAGDTWTFWWWMYVKDDKANLRGFWTVDVSIEGKLAFTEKFTIGPYYETRVEMGGLPETVNIPIKVDGKGYGEIRGGEVKKFGFAPGTSHTLSLTKKEISGETGVRYLAKEDTWEFSAEGSHSFSFAEQCQLNVEVDPAGTVSVSGAGWYDKGATANLGEMPAVVALAEGTQLARRVILVDSKEVETVPSSITMDKPHTVEVQYGKQHYLTVVSEYGAPKGEGWYDERTEARFSVTSPQPEQGFLGLLGGKMIFQAWTGDSTSRASSASVNMDQPRTVRAQWGDDNSVPYVVFGLVGAAIASLALLLFMRRRSSALKRPCPRSFPVAPPPGYSAIDTSGISRQTTSGEGSMITSTSVMEEEKLCDLLEKLEKSHQKGTVSEEIYRRLREDYQTRLTEMRSRKSAPISGKFCLECGTLLPAHAVFCNKCGAKQ